MADSVAFFDHQMNITQRVNPYLKFSCECGWFGVATEFAKHNGFSCCPVCKDFDVRVDNTFTKRVCS